MNYGHKIATKNAPKIMVEFSSPNTNKPLHLGHIRNILLGDSISNIFNKDYLQIEVLGVVLALALYPYIYSASRISFSLIGVNYVNLSKNLGLSKTKSFFKIFSYT